MQKQKINVLAIWARVIKLVKKYPIIIIPFLLIMVVEGIILAILFFAPRPPVSIVLAPIIRNFWGDQYLHYPANFFLLPKLFSYARNAAGFIVGILFTGIAIHFINMAEQDLMPKWWFGVKKAFKRYRRLLVIWTITIVVMFAVLKLFNYLTPVINSAKAIFAIEFFISITIQMLFVMAFPATIIENRKVFSAIKRSLAFHKNYPFVTFLIVLVPGLLLLPVNLLYVKLPALMDLLSPEATLWVIVIRIITIAIVDFFITASATVLLLEKKDWEKKEGLQ